jgi:hypothetical protein
MQPDENSIRRTTSAGKESMRHSLAKLYSFPRSIICGYLKANVSDKED